MDYLLMYENGAISDFILGWILYMDSKRGTMTGFSK